MNLANKLIGILFKTIQNREVLGRLRYQRIVVKYSIEKVVLVCIDLYNDIEGDKK